MRATSVESKYLSCYVSLVLSVIFRAHCYVWELWRCRLTNFRRKVRCSGSQPCEVCIREEVNCEYTSGARSNAISPTHTRASLSIETSTDRSQITESRFGSKDSQHAISRDSSVNRNDTAYSRGNSLEPPQTFLNGAHVGPTSGISFLYGQWEKADTNNRSKAATVEEPLMPKAPLISYGDLPRLDSETLDALPEPTFTAEQVLSITARYFQYISPTYRFHHQPTLESWALAYVTNEQKLSSAKRAAVLLVCAQTLLHSRAAPGLARVGHGDVEMSTACAEKAKLLLEKEPGPPTVISVQARISFCLYALSTFRLNECRYYFSFAITIATALGIHRKQMNSLRIGILETELRKRSFWSLYILDGYLSVMLGRPRLIRDEDVDQTFPLNIADSDLVSVESVNDLPHHGNLEAFINHAKLAKLLARGNDLLYPLRPLTRDEILQRSSEMLDAIARWQDNLPDFLRPRAKTMTGLRTFERQYNILKLGVYHVQILATRRCLLMDYKASFTRGTRPLDPRAQRSIQQCVIAFQMIIDTVCNLIDVGQCYGSFWSTRYIAIVALSTFYVFILQGARNSLPGKLEAFLNIDEWFSKARQCHDHLATLPPPGTQAESHQVLLNHLKIKAEKSVMKQSGKGGSSHLQPSNSKSTRPEPQTENISHATTSVTNQYGDYDTPPVSSDPRTVETLDEAAVGLGESMMLDGSDVFNDMYMFSTMLTPGSSSDTTFPNLVGWECLDTVGFAGHSLHSQNMYSFEMG